MRVSDRCAQGRSARTSAGSGTPDSVLRWLQRRRGRIPITMRDIADPVPKVVAIWMMATEDPGVRLLECMDHGIVGVVFVPLCRNVGGLRPEEGADLVPADVGGAPEPGDDALPALWD